MRVMLTRTCKNPHLARLVRWLLDCLISAVNVLMICVHNHKSIYDFAILVLVTCFVFPPPFTKPICVCSHLSDVCEDLLRVGKVNGAGAGDYRHARNLLCLSENKQRNKLKNVNFLLYKIRGKYYSNNLTLEPKTNVCSSLFVDGRISQEEIF